MLKPGMYVLVRHVKNPKPDRRSTKWENLTEWEPGKRLLVRNYDYGGGTCLVIQTVTGYTNISENEEQFKALAPHLEPAPHNVDSLLAWLHADYSAAPILQELVNAGKITLEDIEAAHNNLHEGD